MSNQSAQSEADGDDLPTDPTDQSIPNHTYDALITILVIVASLVFLVISANFTGIRSSQFDPGAAFWPRAALLIVLLASGINLWQIYRNAKSESRLSRLTSADIGIDLNTNREEKRFIATIIVFGVYLLVVDPVGFVVSTPFFLVIMTRILGYRDRPVKLVSFAVGTTLLFFAVFINFNIALPNGTGPFQDFTIYLETIFSV